MTLQVVPSAVTVPVDGAVLVFASDSGVGVNASWESDDTNVATVHNTDARVIHIKGIATGTATVTATYETLTADCTVTVVSELTTPAYDGLTVKDKNQADLTPALTIPADEIIDLSISKNLSGDHSLDFTIPRDSDAAAEISRGQYIEVENSHHYITDIENRRGSDGNPVLDVSCAHEFFESRFWPVLFDRDRYAGIMNHLSYILYSPRRSISIIFLDYDDSFYNVSRYVEYRIGQMRLDAVNNIMRVFGADYFLWGFYLVVQPYKAAYSASDLTFEYAVNNQSVRRTEKEDDVVTKVHASGGTIENPVEDSGTASSGTDNTLVDTGKSWVTNEWENYGVKITGGTGEGQSRTIASNTNDTLTVTSNWDDNPDNTSTYEVYGDDIKTTITVENNDIKDNYRYPREEYINFGDINNTTDLTTVANQYLKSRERERYSYELSVAELKRLSTPPTGDFSVEVGKIVTVSDTDLGLNDVHKVVRYRYKPLQPASASTVTVGSRQYKIDVKEPPEEEKRIYGDIEGAPEADTDDRQPRIPLYGFVSDEDPDVERGKENDLWIKYEE